MIEYYGVRRISPYLGVIQVVDTGLVRAYSTTGDRWIPRRVYDSERFWSSRDTEGLPEGFGTLPRDALVDALRRRPRLPFPQLDLLELWLLHRDTGLPLALLKTCRWERDLEPVQDPSWRPFMPGCASFAMPELDGSRAACFGDPRRCQQELLDLVNSAAKPHPRAQWFRRHGDGHGTGMEGLRLEPGWEGRVLERGRFPELLVDEATWDSARDRRLVQGFHDWFAPLLLAHQGLSRPLRKRLEEATCRAPARLAESYAMIPEMVDPEAMQVAMVASRLMRSA
jgi:hypothetical protein